MTKNFYTILYKYDRMDACWLDLEKEYDEEEIGRELRRMKRDYPGMAFRRKFLETKEVQVLTARTPGTYIPVIVTDKVSQYGIKYIVYHTKENGNLASVCPYKEGFVVSGYTTWSGNNTRKSLLAAKNLAKKEVRAFFDAIGDNRPLVFC